MSLLANALAYAKRSKFVKFGLPFVTFMVVGSFGLSEFTAIKVSDGGREGERREGKASSFAPCVCREFSPRLPPGKRTRREEPNADGRGVAAVSEEGTSTECHHV